MCAAACSLITSFLASTQNPTDTNCLIIKSSQLCTETASLAEAGTTTDDAHGWLLLLLMHQAEDPSLTLLDGAIEEKSISSVIESESLLPRLVSPQSASLGHNFALKHKWVLHFVSASTASSSSTQSLVRHISSMQQQRVETVWVAYWAQSVCGGRKFIVCVSLPHPPRLTTTTTMSSEATFWGEPTQQQRQRMIEST